MSHNSRLPRFDMSFGAFAFCVAAVIFAACATPESGGDGGSGGGATGGSGSPGSGGDSSTGGSTGGHIGTGGASGGSTGTGGLTGTGGAVSTGGVTGTGGASGGSTGTGGTSTGGVTGTGGAKGGTTGTGGTSTGGVTGTGGAKGGTTGTGGAPATGGTTGTGGTGMGGTGIAGSSGAAGAVTVDCSATLPTSGGTAHSGSTQGSAAGQQWQIWMNAGSGSITTYSTPAFSSTWTLGSNNDFLARTGLKWSGKAYTALGTVNAEMNETKTGFGGSYSYIGIYGWATGATTSQNSSGCVEWYIVDDSWNKMPVNPGNTTSMGTATIDGGTYNIYTRTTTGTGGNSCGSSVQQWMQYYSVRTTARTCGTISISQHWAAWNATNKMPMGNPIEASVLVEVGGGSGGTGSIQFPAASVTSQ